MDLRTTSLKDVASLPVWPGSATTRGHSVHDNRIGEIALSNDHFDPSNEHDEGARTCERYIYSIPIRTLRRPLAVSWGGCLLSTLTSSQEANEGAFCSARRYG